MKRSVVLFALFALLCSALPAAAQTKDDLQTDLQLEQQTSDTSDRLELYTADVSNDELGELRRMHDEDVLAAREIRGERGRVRVEMALTSAAQRRLEARGIDLELYRNEQGQTFTQETSAALAAAEADDEPFRWRSFSEEGGIEDQLYEIAGANSDILKLQSIGKSVQGQDILALKLTRNATRLPDGRRPAVLYSSLQHAREWITVEMNVRLLEWFIAEYRAGNSEVERILNRTELWFIPVANPDGYDYTFTEGNRLWRKNLRDNDGDGEITNADGVDLNRNFSYRWGYDNEGSSPNISSQVYRGPAPNSEPETQAMDSLFQRVPFVFQVNYHSAAELILYGVGFQVDTPTPDDVILSTLAGTDEEPAIPGYDPDLSAELYITNGATTDHVAALYNTLAYTPEMSTCQTVFIEGDPPCQSGFNFPEDGERVQAEFEKNIPFALDIAKSARDPYNPVSHLGNVAPDFVPDTFEVSYGDPQTVATWASREIRSVRMWYTINGGRRQLARTTEWEGGERYGKDFDGWYKEVRGEVTGAKPGDTVEVYFEGRGERSEPFTYTVASDSGADVLIFAEEDYTGIVPAQEPDGPHYLSYYTDALDAAGVSYDVYDFDAMERQAPHPLGVLDHYEAVVWYTGDNIVTRNPGGNPGTTAPESEDIVTNIRDYLNEGGKLLYTGDDAGFTADNQYSYAENGQPDTPCTTGSGCLFVSNDFLQYWLGVWDLTRGGGLNDEGNPNDVVGTDNPLDGLSFGLNGEDSADNADSTHSALVTSDFLPPDEFPQFGGRRVARWDGGGAVPFEPVTGDYYAATQQADGSYKRLSQSVDLSDAKSASLEFAASWDIETGWDFAIVEVQDRDGNWTTLPEAGGATTQDLGPSCQPGVFDLADIHPFLRAYRDADCNPTGTTGEWHALTGSSEGSPELEYDLSAFAGQQIQVSISYVSDNAVQNLGLFVDDARVVVDGVAVNETSFETDLGDWTVPGAPESSPGNFNDWIRSELLFAVSAAVATEDTLYFGFGFEAIATQDARNEVMQRALDYLLGNP